jgi:hypothetical protein
VKWTHVVRTVWNAVVNWIRQESAATSALVLAFIALGIAFAWWSWSTAQTGAVFGITAALLAMFVRSQVTPIARNKPPRRLTATGQAAPQGRTLAEPPDWPDRPADPPAGPGTRPF